MVIVRESKKVLNVVIKFRFLISIVFVALFIAFKLNMSSIGMWNQQITQTSSGKEDTSVIVGEPKAIRTDEWKIQTPFYLAQAANGFKVNNKNMSENGQNMILNYNAPVLDVTILGKPFNWGMLFLGKDRGLSWYWSVKLVGILLLAYEFCMILTKKKYLSLLGSTMITFAPAVQWWFMQHNGDLVFFTLAIIVSIYHLFFKKHKIWQQILFALLFMSSAIGFVLVVYPAFQVPFAYFIIAMLIGLFIKEKSAFRFSKSNVILMVISCITIIAVLLHFYHVSATAISALLNTAYPGKRFSTGGPGVNMDVAFAALFNYLINWKLPYTSTLGFSSSVEVSTYFNLLPLFILFLPKIIKTSKKNAVALVLSIQTIGLLLWYFVTFPKWFAKVSLLSYVPSSRVITMIGFNSMILTIWLIGWIWDSYQERQLSQVEILLVSGTMCMIFAWAMVLGQTRLALRGWPMVLTIVIATGLVYLLLSQQKTMFSIILIVLIICSGVTVNPLTVGTSAIYKKKIVKQIEQVDSQNKGQVWLSDFTTSNLLPMLNIKSIGNTTFVPDLKMWHKLDPKRKFETQYNRYTNMSFNIVNQDNVLAMGNPASDSINVNVRPSDLKKLRIKKVLTKQDLSTLSTNKVKFKLLASDKKDYIQIYDVIYK